MNPKPASTDATVTPTGIPSVGVWADPTQRGWRLVVGVCPFCGQQHIHGGGDIDLPPTYGIKTAHCATSSQYNLMPRATYC